VRVRELETRAALVERRARAAELEGMRDEASRLAGQAADMHAHLARIWARRMVALLVLSAAFTLWALYDLVRLVAG
jgi:hypothetical protein